jgi:hypothetical protein
MKLLDTTAYRNSPTLHRTRAERRRLRAQMRSLLLRRLWVRERLGDLATAR